ncbi:MAG: hypothetical protein JWQ25_1125, partial [Daejeonella sp.]|nr:hypothetical protein [Daejeonella sp.]
MKKIIFSIVALICLLIGFVQFRNIKELASGMFSSRTEVTPAIAMQDILPTNIAIEDSVKVDSTLNIQAEKLSTTESDAEKLDTTRNAAAEALTEEKNSIGHSQSETKGTSPEAAVSNSKIEIEEFANIPTANSKSSSSNVDELPLKNNQKIAKSKDKNLQILTTFAEKKTVTPQPSVVKKENIKVEIATNNSQKAAKIIPLTSLKETSTKATKAGNNDKLGSNVTMYASLLTPKSNDNTEIIKEYINDELLPKEPETVPIAPKSESQLTQGIDEKFTPVDTMNAIKTAKIMEVSTPAEHPSKKNQTVESTSYTSVVESTLLPNISYSNTQNFTVGMQITPLIPLNSGSVIPATIYGHVSTIAGGGPNGDSGLKNGISLSARFYYPYSAVVDTKGNIYVADQGNSLIRKITPSGIVSTLAGSGSAGFADGVGTAASFSNPKGLAVDSAGNVYVADAVNNRIRKITSEGVVTTLAGNSASGFIDGLGNQASFYNPSAIALDAKGNLYVADEKNHAVRKISPSGEVNTLAGNGSSGSVNGNGAEASFNYPSGIALDGFGN